MYMLYMSLITIKLQLHVMKYIHNLRHKTWQRQQEHCCPLGFCLNYSTNFLSVLVLEYLAASQLSSRYKIHHVLSSIVVLPSYAASLQSLLARRHTQQTTQQASYLHRCLRSMSAAQLHNCSLKHDLQQQTTLQ